MKVALFSGVEILGRLEEASRFEVVLVAPNGRRVTVFKHGILTLEDLTEAKP